MSHDLEVFLSSEPHLASIAAEIPGLAVDEANGQTWVGRATRGVGAQIFTADGPLTVDRTDLPEPVANAAVGLRSVVELSSPAASSVAHRTVMLKFARRLAEAGHGVVYDPQADKNIWPRGPRRRPTLPSAEERIALIQLEFYMVGLGREELVHNAIALLQRWLPEAVPRRFGSFEPLQSTLEIDGIDGFVTELETGGDIFWSTARPFFGGSLWRGDAIEELLRRVPGGVPSEPEGPRVDRLVLDLDSRVLGDSRWRQDVLDGFAAIAGGLSAVYARAWVDPGWVAANGRVWADAQTGGRRAPLIHSREAHWLGLRPDPVWLAWFGTRFGTDGVGEVRGSGRLFIAAGEFSQSGIPPEERPPMADEWMTTGGRRAAVVPTGL